MPRPSFQDNLSSGILTIGNIATLMHCAPQTLRRWIEARNVPVISRVSSREEIRIHLVTIVQHLQVNNVTVPQALLDAHRIYTSKPGALTVALIGDKLSTVNGNDPSSGSSANQLEQAALVDPGLSPVLVAQDTPVLQENNPNLNQKIKNVIKKERKKSTNNNRQASKHKIIESNSSIIFQKFPSRRQQDNILDKEASIDRISSSNSSSPQQLLSRHQQFVELDEETSLESLTDTSKQIQNFPLEKPMPDHLQAFASQTEIAVTQSQRIQAHINENQNTPVQAVCADGQAASQAASQPTIAGSEAEVLSDEMLNDFPLESDDEPSLGTL